MTTKARKFRKPHAHWIAREFEAWLKVNRHRFAREPYLVKKTSSGAAYKFRGVTGRIQLYMDLYQFLIWVGDYDLIWEADVSLEKTDTGRYFSSLITRKYRRFFGSRAALVHSECFEPLIEWVNSKLRSENVLMVLGKPRGWSAACILEPAAAKRQKKYVRFRYPVILGNARSLNFRIVPA